MHNSTSQFKFIFQIHICRCDGVKAMMRLLQRTDRIEVNDFKTIFTNKVLALVLLFKHSLVLCLFLAERIITVDYLELIILRSK